MSLAAQLHALEHAMPLRVVGQVAGVSGLTVEATHLPLPIGTLCDIDRFGRPPCRAQVIGFARERTLLMPLSEVSGVAAGDPVENAAASPRVRCGPKLLGRVINGFGEPIDGKGPVALGAAMPLEGRPIAPMERALVREPIATGVRAIDALHTCGLGQRMGIFAGPGVGKSTLLGWISRHTSADVSVIALVGERGREVREFLDNVLGPEGLARCVVVVSTAEDTPLLKVRAAKVACAVAEYFRDEGRHVLLLMDSITRLCHAQRQIGLAAREPPATKGYPPSVFALLPELLERAGNAPRGSITGFYTVLVEGDDFNEPVPDAVKGITDGHVWLDRKLAERGHFPAIDPLRSISRVRGEVTDRRQVEAARAVQKVIADYEAIEDLVSIGAYVPGASIENDVAVRARDSVLRFLQQAPDKPTDLAAASRQLLELHLEIEALRRALTAAPAAQGATAGATRGPAGVAGPGRAGGIPL